MRLRLPVACAIAALALGFISAPRAAAGVGPGSFTKHTDPGVGTTGPRDYWVYEPTAPAEAPRPLVVYLHGCNQDARDAAVGTRWNELAERRGFVVAYPEQSSTANGLRCWNWFERAHQSRGGGEPAVIAQITRSVIEVLGVDPTRVYVLGASAGADMATIVAATYPDLFAAQGAFAGCPYATCSDVTGAAAYAAMGERARVVPAFVVQGTVDPLNNFAMGEALVRQWIGTNDLADNGSADGSVPARATRVEHHGLDATLASGLGTVGDPCVRSRQWPCAGAAAGWKDYPHTIEHYDNAAACAVVDFWIVHGLSHDYPGGDPAGTFTDPIGPDITTAAYEFFLRHRLGAAPCTTELAASSPGVGGDQAAAPPPGRDGAPVDPAGRAPGAADEHPPTGGAAAPARLSFSALALTSFLVMRARRR